jgi:hypothetical protein
LHCFIKEANIEMAIKDWDDDWRIPVPNRKISTVMEEGVGQG